MESHGVSVKDLHPPAVDTSTEMCYSRSPMRVDASMRLNSCERGLASGAVCSLLQHDACLCRVRVVLGLRSPLHCTMSCKASLLHIKPLHVSACRGPVVWWQRQI